MGLEEHSGVNVNFTSLQRPSWDHQYVGITEAPASLPGPLRYQERGQILAPNAHLPPHHLPLELLTCVTRSLPQEQRPQGQVSTLALDSARGRVLGTRLSAQQVNVC